MIEVAVPPTPTPQQPVLSCVAASVLSDLETLHYSTWNITNTGGKTRSSDYYTVSNTGIHYKLITRVYDSQSRYVDIIGIDGEVFSQQEQNILWAKIRVIQDQQDAEMERNLQIANQSKLKELFPGCYKA